MSIAAQVSIRSIVSLFGLSNMHFFNRTYAGMAARRNCINSAIIIGLTLDFLKNASFILIMKFFTVASRGFKYTTEIVNEKDVINDVMLDLVVALLEMKLAAKNPE